MPCGHTIGAHSYQSASLREQLAKSSPQRAGDQLPGMAVAGALECVAAQVALADVPLLLF